MDTEYFWKKKVIVSWIMSVLVLIIHTTSINETYSLEDGGRFAEIINYSLLFFQKGIPSFAVPLFFMISGGVFFRNYEQKLYFSKLKSRCRSILIPYLLWNMIYLIFGWVTSAFFSQYFTGRESFVPSIKNIVKAIFYHGQHSVFWFVFYLFMFQLVSPVIYEIVKRKKLAWVVLVMLIFIQALGFASSIQNSHYTALIYYMFGAALQIHHPRFYYQESDKQIRLAAYAIFIILAFVIYAYRIKIIYLNSGLATILLILFAVSAWFLFDEIIPRIKVSHFMHHFFMIYAMQSLFVPIILHLVHIVLPKDPVWAIVNFVITVVCSLTIIEIACRVGEQYFRNIYRVMSGTR